ncbi:MAG TPA: RNA methyltransferase, partial [Acidimicrobiia bacterium]|nr:RNA methyltransferase [Acidimicrobiia bacterium]
GPNLVLAAIASGIELETVFALVGDPVAESVSDPTFVSPEVLERLAPTQHPRGPVAVMAIPPTSAVSRSCLFLWGIGDPGNVGTLIRSASAFGMDVAVDSTSSDPWSPKALRAAAGAHFRTTIEMGATLISLRSRGFTAVAAVPRTGSDPAGLGDLSPVAIIVGSEARGLPTSVVNGADQLVTIPMPGGMESLNAGIAGAILAYEWSRHGIAPR